MEGHPGFVNCSIGVDIIPYSADEIEGTPFFILNLGVGGTMRLGNHHYWLDPGNTTIIARNITDKLAEVDLPNAPYYRGNYERFSCALQRASQGMGQAHGAVSRDADRQLPPELELSASPSRPESLRLHRAEGDPAAQRGLHGVAEVDRMKRSGVKIILAETYQNCARSSTRSHG